MMKTNIITIAAICTAMMACNSNQTDTAVTNRVELPGTVDNEAFAGNVESISVMNLQMDDDWVFGTPHFVFSDNYMYMIAENIENYTMKMLCFDKLTGEKTSSRAIRGNGPGEINYLNALFCIGDTLCIYDGKYIIRQYNSKGAFLGKMHECDETFSGSNHIMRLKNGDYAFLLRGNGLADSVRPAILLTDKSFNIKSRYCTIPQSSSSLTSGQANPYFVNDDTVRFFLSFDSHIYSLCGGIEQNIELVLPNLLTEKIYNSVNIGDFKKYREMALTYDGYFSSFGESGRFLFFQYQKSGTGYLSMIDKNTNNIVSKSKNSYGESENRVADMLNRINYLYSDGKYIYGRYQYSVLADFFDNFGDQLDERLQKTKAEFQTCLERNADYIKGLEPGELGQVSILAKIKLKD